MSRERRVIIFEGPDGGGKTTLAHALSRKLGSALFTHCDAFPNLTDSFIGDAYRHAVAPAINNTCDVILDRSWLSEVPYGRAFRGSKYRLPQFFQRDIERELQTNARPLVVLCLPPLETCLDVFRSRPREEYLKNQDQLAIVYSSYLAMTTALPVMKYDRTSASINMNLERTISDIERRLR